MHSSSCPGLSKQARVRHSLAVVELAFPLHPATPIPLQEALDLGQFSGCLATFRTHVARLVAFGCLERHGNSYCRPAKFSVAPKLNLPEKRAELRALRRRLASDPAIVALIREAYLDSPTGLRPSVAAKDLFSPVVLEVLNDWVLTGDARLDPNKAIYLTTKGRKALNARLVLTS